jgi:exodeoxyribonuclease V beta subunit
VALTRAKHHCVVVWGAINDMQTSSLGYVLHSQGADRPDDLAGVAEYVGSLSDDALRDDLNRLAIASNGTIKIEISDETECTSFQPETEQNYDLSVLQTQRTLRRQWQISSFSGLTAHGTELSPDEAEGRDRDSVDATSSVRSFYKPPEVSANALHPITLIGFGGGFQAGDMLHAIYENLDFQYDKRQTLETLVREQLDRFSFDAVRWQPTVSRAIEENIHTHLDPDEPELCLSEIAMGHRFNELEFLFPVSNRYNPNESGLTGHALAAVFAENGAADVSQHYINRLKRLSFVPLKGFLKGFIDLIFQYKGRWYVVDYKSNFLGEQYQDYTAKYMADTMAEHHYYLQYHIYTVALHRLLSHRIKNYDYDIHFGKVYYLFLRGMSPHTGPEYGVFSDRPAAKLIKALSDLFGNGD